MARLLIGDFITWSTILLCSFECYAKKHNKEQAYYWLTVMHRVRWQDLKGIFVEDPRKNDLFQAICEASRLKLLNSRSYNTVVFDNVRCNYMI